MFENGKSFQKPHRMLQVEQEDCCSESSSALDVTHLKLKDGLWSEEEVFKFVSYLAFNRQALKLKLQRRTNKIFKQMAVFIKSRSSVQCRSQNQRLFRKYKNMRNIVASFKEEYGGDRFQYDYNQIINDPLIKFKTQYENYIQQHLRKVCEVATQTQDPSSLPLSTPQVKQPLDMGCEYMLPFNGIFSNWIVLPFCS